jgi:hypothetical protein
LQFLKPDFDRARSMRNSRVHKDAHTFMGVIGYPINNIRLFINLINQIFQKESEIKKITTEHNRIKKILETYDNKPMIYSKDKKYLIDSILLFKYIKFNQKELLVLMANPILINAYNTYTTYTTVKPILITFKEFKISNEEITGIDLNDKEVSITFTNKIENLNIYNNFIEERGKVPEPDLQIYESIIYRDAPWEMERIIYENCWF